MDKKSLQWIAALLGIFLGAWLVLRYVYPIILPFLLGWGLAALAEPGVRFLVKRLRLRRGFAAAVVVTAAILGIVTILVLLAAFGYRESVELIHRLPGVMEELTAGISVVRDWTLQLVGRAPAGIAGVLEETVRDLFAGGSVLITKVTDKVLGFAGSVMGGISGGALLVGTAVVSAYLISAQYPALGQRLKSTAVCQWISRIWVRMRRVVGSWLRAQLRLSGVTFLVVWAGFLLLGVEHSFFGALGTAVVDAVPMLGTGIVLIPWAVLMLVQGNTARGLGLAAVWLAAMLNRSALEPRLVGKHLGINPLVTLAALYAGFQIWGVGGMIFAPILTVMAKELANAGD